MTLWRRTRGESGQAAVELLGVLPLLLLAGLLALQVSAASWAVQATGAAARAAARADSRGADPEAAARAAVPRWLEDDVKVDYGPTIAGGRLVRVQASLPRLPAVKYLPFPDTVTRSAWFPPDAFF